MLTPSEYLRRGCHFRCKSAINDLAIIRMAEPFIVSDHDHDYVYHTVFRLGDPKISVTNVKVPSSPSPTALSASHTPNSSLSETLDALLSLTTTA
ncbi:hypothetical protein DY000_02002368 [Brassica cretica]|uniref:Uncharacterized protein n=1 Tax=Brassica cretica TaxID=69181 RepID=A0ABQ7CGY4_BRACR|nr:hypothetical protein DY000_02002368 [Brassica cretica]